MSPIETIIAQLEGVSRPVTSKSGTSIRALCPSCGGGNKSKLIVTEQPSGNVLAHCFAGCAAIDILNVIGLDFSDLFADQKRSKPTVAHSRHDAHALTAMAINILQDSEFLLLQHAVKPVEGILMMLADNAHGLKQIKELLQKGNAK